MSFLADHPYAYSYRVGVPAVERADLGFAMVKDCNAGSGGPTAADQEAKIRDVENVLQYYKEKDNAPSRQPSFTAF